MTEMAFSTISSYLWDPYLVSPHRRGSSAGIENSPDACTRGRPTHIHRHELKKWPRGKSIDVTNSTATRAAIASSTIGNQRHGTYVYLRKTRHDKIETRQRKTKTNFTMAPKIFLQVNVTPRRRRNCRLTYSQHRRDRIHCWRCSFCPEREVP